MACYISTRYNCSLIRRLDKGDELIAAEFSPELFVIMIFGTPVNTLYTNSENYVNMWFSRDRKRVAEQRHRQKRVVGLHFQLLQPLPGHPNPPVASIQLCINGGVFIYHMYNASDLPTELQEFLDDPYNTFFGVNTEHEWQLFVSSTLCNGNIACRNLGALAADYHHLPELVNADLTQLALTVLRKNQLTLKVEGREFGMQEVNPNWDRHTLLDEQLMYATISAYVSYEMGRVLTPDQLN